MLKSGLLLLWRVLLALGSLLKWGLLAIAAVIGLSASAYGLYKVFSMWTYETELMEHDKPYGGGDMRIRSRQVMVFKPIGPEIKFKEMTEEEKKNPETYRSVVTESWMNDTSEQLNRHTVRLLRGDMDKGIRRIFEKPGQDGGWWLSPDWQTIYVSTEWTNYHLPSGEDGYGQRWFTLWKSVDGGQQWQQLPWPERTPAGQPFFMPDGVRGYLIADGLRIWRTRNGGQHWEPLPLPNWANQRLMMNPDGNGFSPMVKDTRTRFDAYDVADDGTLRVALYVRKARLVPPFGEVAESTLLYSLPFAIKREDLVAKWMRPDAVFKQQSLMDIKASKDGGLHLMALQGQLQPDQKIGEQLRPAAYVHWRQGKETYRHVFEPHVVPGALFVGPQDQLVLAGESQQPGRVLRDSITLVSTDGGRDWDETNDGGAYAWYYEPESNRIWKYEYHSLYWRKLN